MKHTVKPEEAGTRLDALVTQLLGNVSRTFVQKGIKAGDVLLNEKQVTPHFAVREGDVLDITVTVQPERTLQPQDAVAFEVIHEAPTYVVVNKPAGLMVHPAPNNNEPTLIEGVIAKYPDITHIGEHELRPGMVHRLDKDVSGVMVIARTQKMFESLKQQFQARTIYKEYTALVHGIVTEDGVIDMPIGRSKNQSGKMAAHTEEHAGDKPARTEYHVIETFKDWSLLQVIIHTGRTHQIRVHLNAKQFPVVGDTLYTNKRVTHKDIGRLFLHATKLAFDDLEGVHVSYEAPLPQDLQQVLIDLKG